MKAQKKTEMTKTRAKLMAIGENVDMRGRKVGLRFANPTTGRLRPLRINPAPNPWPFPANILLYDSAERLDTFVPLDSL